MFYSAPLLLLLFSLLQLEVEFFVALERLQVDSVPISIASSDSETKRGGEVNPETFPELASDRSDGH